MSETIDYSDPADQKLLRIVRLVAEDRGESFPSIVRRSVILAGVVEIAPTIPETDNPTN